MEKYHFYLLKKDDPSIVKKIFKSNKKTDIISESKKYIKSKFNELNKAESIYELILLKYQKVRFDENQPIKMVFGPIKISITFFKITDRLSIKENRDDKRNNHLFLTKNFLENNNKKPTILKYLKAITEMASKNKLEKRLLAPKTIDQIKIKN